MTEILVFESDVVHAPLDENLEPDSVLVFESDPPAQAISDEADVDDVGLLVFEPELIEAQVIEQDSGFVLIDESRPAVAVELPEMDEVVVITSAGTEGPPGDPGGKGDKGDKGDRGPAGFGITESIYGFAVPSTEWVIFHELNTYGVLVETVDHTGQPLEGSVRYIDLNTLAVDWYYPTAGTARIYR